MNTSRHHHLAAACLFAAVAGACPVRPAHASGFTDFAADEDVCRRAGTAAIGPASGPAAARRYDGAYRGCMAAHIRGRQMQAWQRSVPPDDAGANPPSLGFPDAYYSVPYATPGYGYDGFSY